MFTLPAQFIDCRLVDSLEHVRPRLTNDVLKNYWRVSTLIIITNDSSAGSTISKQLNEQKFGTIDGELCQELNERMFDNITLVIYNQC